MNTTTCFHGEIKKNTILFAIFGCKFCLIWSYGHKRVLQMALFLYRSCLQNMLNIQSEFYGQVKLVNTVKVMSSQSASHTFPGQALSSKLLISTCAPSFASNCQ